jgi:hypothetical protein
MSGIQLPLPGFEEILPVLIEAELQARALRSLEERQEMIDDGEIEPDYSCYSCMEDKAGEPYNVLDVFSRPFEDESSQKSFCSEECERASREPDFAFVDCPHCERTIYEQNPSNGYMLQFRRFCGEYICLKCYEELILEHGLPREYFEEQKLQGMFFSSDNSEPLEAGFDYVDGFQDVFIQSQESVDKVCDTAMKLIDEGHKVLIGYERMSNCGGEGWISMFSKPSDCED